MPTSPKNDPAASSRKTPANVEKSQPDSTDQADDTDVDLSATQAESSPQMPHERDERVGMTGGVPSERVAQGARDLARGVEDTSRSPEADRAYDRQKK